MGHDGDTAKLILERLKSALRRGDHISAMQLLRRADATGSLRADAGMLSALKSAVGEKASSMLVDAFGRDACPYCIDGRDKCEECGGKGQYYQVSVCPTCAGFGVRRCSFCNGAAFAGYDFVPRGMRPAVMLARLSLARERIDAAQKDLGKMPLGVQDTVKRIAAIDQCRCIWGDAVEQACLNEVGAPGGVSLYTPAERMRIESECREANGGAEAAIRGLLRSLADHFARRAGQSTDNESVRTLFSYRAGAFTALSNEADFGDSVLCTPVALRQQRVSNHVAPDHTSGPKQGLLKGLRTRISRAES